MGKGVIVGWGQKPVPDTEFQECCDMFVPLQLKVNKIIKHHYEK